MGKQTYYIVQTWRDLYVRKDAMGYGVGYGKDKAAHLSLSEAHRLYREHKARRFTLPEAMSEYKTACRNATADTPLRFPRILKVTTETKTITPRRKRK